ncbi:hypothetical protein AVEN_270479-1 [Araneus ventricosus]|uniref:DUF19 domain-containing protein n=1 Tax=Araneus ventricosus TaxID=182803 RepID=A0A4Y2B4A2_ARAVE|nr:hypothetical protein AVEN_270479-1 [Araneus ventricosus]
MGVIKTLFIFAALMAVSHADCSVDGLKCCLSEFLPLVSPAGIRLTKENLNNTCKVAKGSLECISDYSDQCVARGNDILEGNINKTKVFIITACSNNFLESVEEYEDCFTNSSLSFQKCYNKTLLPDTVGDDDEAKWKAECCAYKNLRNCAVQTVEDSCGIAASELLQKEISNINGAGLEVACEDVFDKCSSLGVMLASSLLPFILLYALYTFRFFYTGEHTTFAATKSSHNSSKLFVLPSLRRTRQKNCSAQCRAHIGFLCIYKFSMRQKISPHASDRTLINTLGYYKVVGKT